MQMRDIVEIRKRSQSWGNVGDMVEIGGGGGGGGGRSIVENMELDGLDRDMSEIMEKCEGDR